MKRSFFLLLLIVSGISFLPKKVLAQDTLNLITGEFKELSFEAFVKEVESQTSYRFYYSPPDLDSIAVTISVSKKPLSEVLNMVLDTSVFNYAIDHRNLVFVSKVSQVQTGLPEGLFTVEEEIDNSQNVISEIKTGNTESKKRIGSVEHRITIIGKKTPHMDGIATLSGVVKEVESGTPVSGAYITVVGRATSAITGSDGTYSIPLPKGSNTINIKSLGLQSTSRKLIIYSDGKMDIHMELSKETDEVVVFGKTSQVDNMEMGEEKLTIQTIRQTPTVFGEADILRVIMTLPGVKTAGEASTGFNVRGGGADQNLILFNDAVVYNPSHLFGFFSAFNPDVVKSVELYKSNIPANHGGRLSSVLDIITREGNQKKLVGSGGIGLLTGRLTLEGPIIKDRTSFIIGGRSTYSNWLLNRLKNSVYSGSSASFYDLNLLLTHKINDKNHLNVTAYHSSDRFNLKKEVLYGYRNRNLVLKWRREFSRKLKGTFTGSSSSYEYDVASESSPISAYKLYFGINQYQFKSDFNYTLNTQHTLTFGLSSMLYNLQPGKLTPFGTDSRVNPDVVQREQALESAIYISDMYELNPRLSFNVGIRLALFNYLGPKTVYTYPEGIPKTINTIGDTLNYKKGAIIKSYMGPEYRLTARYMLRDNMSVKVSYNTSRQFIHMLSNTTAISPTDIWKLSDANIEPTQGTQLSLGLYGNMRSKYIEASVEVYRKKMSKYLDYKAGAQLLQNHHVETDVISTEGKAYGAEFMLKKTKGKLNGWMSYTYSRTLLRMNDPSQGELVNDGSWYPASFDKPHDFTFIGNYKFSHRFSTSLNLTYSTGRPVTLPIAIYDLAGSQRVLYADRNQYRIPDYFRVDLSVNIEGNHKIRKLAHSSWTLAVYNLTGRKNVYSVYFRSENGKINGYKLSVFGQPIPTITYNFRF